MVGIEITYGVLQGFLLWDVAYDAMFRLPLSMGAICNVFATDTVVEEEGDTASETEDRVNSAFVIVAGHIGDLDHSLLSIRWQPRGVSGCRSCDCSYWIRP